MQDHYLRLKHKNAKQSKRKKVFGLKRPSNNNQSIRMDIANAKSPSDVLDIILFAFDTERIIDSSVYGKAMQKCDKLRDWNSVIQIMDLLIDNKNVNISLVEFNIFFDSMAHSNAERLRSQNVKYFDIMLNKFQLKPNLFIFATLIKGCCGRGSASYCELAEKYFSLMLNEYKLAPNSFIYTAMITVYARAEKDIYKTKATELFIQYLSKMQTKKLEKDAYVFGAYLTVFTKVGDIDGMNNVLSMIEENGVDFNYALYANVLHGFLRAKRPRECIEKFKQFEQELLAKQRYPNNAMYQLQCVALSDIIRFERSELSFNAKYKIYKELKWIIYIHRLYQHPNIMACLLSAIIVLWHDKKPMHIVKLFELFVEKELFAYYGNVRNERQIAIDLHGFPLLLSQFILRYFFGYKLLEYNIDAMDCLTIIVGKGQNPSNDGKTKAFVVQQLTAYTPPIICTFDGGNDGVLLVQKDQITPYMTDAMNCAKRKLTLPSTDWHFEAKDT